MDAPRAATWLLELVTSPDRATAIVGDFAEESTDHSRPWFSFQITQTFVALIVREFTSAGPGLILKCILRSLAYLWVGVIVSMLVGDVIWMRIVTSQTLPSGIGFKPAVPPLAILVVGAPLFVRAGWLLAEKTSRPIAATFTFAIVCFFLTRNPHDAAHPFAPWISLLVFIGSIWQRRHAVRNLKTAI